MLTPIPPHLASRSAQGLKPHETIAQYEIGSMQNFVYLLIDWEEKACAWIDPQKDLSGPLQAIEEHGLKLERILLTHCHHDHIAGVPELLERFPNLPVHVGTLDHLRLPTSWRSSPQILSVEDGTTVRVGNLTCRAIHTPGHSAGEICWFVEKPTPYLFTGDTVFIRDCGRTDLPTGSNEELFQSLQKIKKLPLETIILPGHHYAEECASSLSAEMETSPPFRCRSVAELEALP